MPLTTAVADVSPTYTMIARFDPVIVHDALVTGAPAYVAGAKLRVDVPAPSATAT